MPVRVVETSPSSSTPWPCSGGTQGSTMPQPCALLSAGQTFSGTQNVSTQQKDEAWRVNVQIQGCDLDHGYLCGTMEALNVPMAETPLNQEKISAIQSWPIPSNVKELQGFLGLIGYYRWSVLGYGRIPRTLTDLTKEMSFEWNEDAEVASHKLKKALTSVPILIFHDSSQPLGGL